MEAEALRHVSSMFPIPLLWKPYEAGATFPAGYAFEGKPVASKKLSTILTTIDPVDFTGVLDPIFFLESIFTDQDPITRHDPDHPLMPNRLDL